MFPWYHFRFLCVSHPALFGGVALVLSATLLTLGLWGLLTTTASDNTSLVSKPPRALQPGEAFVIRVVDGDTIELSTGERVRYIGINTPETVDPRRGVQCFGHQASYRNKTLVEGQIVRLEADITDKDAYDRLLRYVYVGDDFINLQLVREGYATVYTFPPNVRYVNQLVVAQKEAREAKRGLWGACPNAG